MHADGGKANQYYLRGWNLDHGTDLAMFVDDMPINLPTHAHGQGYTDLNWLIPETVSGLDIRKGPYFADVGDFATAGKLYISLLDTVDQNISRSRWAASATRLSRAGLDQARRRILLYAGEFNSYDGPWTTPDDMKKVQRTSALQPGYGDRRLFAHRDGLYQHLEFDRSDCAARYDGRPDRPLWRIRSD